MEENGFELLNIDIVGESSSKIFGYRKNSGIVNECDAVFGIKQKFISELDLTYKISYLGFLFSYGLYNECLFMINAYTDLNEYLYKKLKIKPNKLVALLEKC
jgi:hypothetical protein